MTYPKVSLQKVAVYPPDPNKTTGITLLLDKNGTPYFGIKGPSSTGEEYYKEIPIDIPFGGTGVQSEEELSAICLPDIATMGIAGVGNLLVSKPRTGTVGRYLDWIPGLLNVTTNGYYLCNYYGSGSVLQWLYKYGA